MLSQLLSFDHVCCVVYKQGYIYNMCVRSRDEKGAYSRILFLLTELPGLSVYTCEFKRYVKILFFLFNTDLHKQGFIFIFYLSLTIKYVLELIRKQSQCIIQTKTLFYCYFRCVVRLSEIGKLLLGPITIYVKHHVHVHRSWGMYIAKCKYVSYDCALF